MKATLQTTLVLLTMVVVAQAALAAPADDQYAVAASHYADQQWEFAVEEFDAFLERFPQHHRTSDAEFYAAEALVQMRKFKEAGPRFEKFMLKNQRHSQASRALFRWGECTYYAGDQVEALRLLSQFTEQNEDSDLNQYALPYLGNLHADANELSAARHAFDEALEEFPTGGLADECHLQLAILDYREAKFSSVINGLARLNAAFPNSRFRGESAYWRGMAHFQQSQYEPAAAAFQNVFKSSSHRRAAASLYFAGESWRRRGDEDQAKTFFQTLIGRKRDRQWADDALVGLIRISLLEQDFERLDADMAVLESEFANSPRIFEARQLYAESLVKRNHNDEAIRLLTELTEPGSDAANHGKKSTAVNLYLLGIAYLGAEQPQPAIEALDRISISRALSPYFIAQLRLAKATAYDHLGQHEDAITTAREALSANPPVKHAGKLRLTLIRNLLKQNEYKKADTLFRQWEKSRPAGTEQLNNAVRYLADYCFDQKQYKRGLTHYGRLLSADTDSQLYGLSGLAWCQFQLENHQEAATLFEQLTTRFPLSDEAQHAKVARARSLQLLGQTEDALPIYEEIIALQDAGQEWVFASLAVAEILEEKGELQRAYEVLTTLRDHPDAQLRQDQVLYQLGWISARLGQTAEAIAAFDQLHREHPSSQHWADATFRLADHQFKSRDAEAASELLDLISQNPPAELDAKLASFTLHLRGRVAATEGRWSDVLSPMQKLISEYPSGPLADSARFWLGEAHYQLTNYDAAEKHLNAIDSSINEPWLAMVLLRQAQIKSTRRRWDEVISYVQMLQHRFPDFGRQYEAIYLTGRVHSVRGEFREAREAFQTVVDSEDGHLTETAAIAQWMIGETHLHQKQFKDALRAYLKVEKIYDYPRWRAAALLQAGKCCERLGQVDQARQLYERLTQQLPTTSYHAAAKRRLKSIKPSSATNDPQDKATDE